MSYRSRLQPPLSVNAAGNPNLVPLPPQGNIYTPGRFHNPNLSADAQQRTQLAPVIPATSPETSTVPIVPVPVVSTPTSSV